MRNGIKNLTQFRILSDQSKPNTVWVMFVQWHVTDDSEQFIVFLVGLNF